MKRPTPLELARARNPFADPLVTELIEEPHLYRQTFSEAILVGETLQVFRPSNVVVLGPQGSGKSMLLNLVRVRVLGEWVTETGAPPGPLTALPPFFGISVNLVRAGFHVFGRRSFASETMSRESASLLDATLAGDFLNHYLLRECLLGLDYVFDPKKKNVRKWMGFPEGRSALHSIVEGISQATSWQGYYPRCSSIRSLIAKVDARLAICRSFLNANRDDIPEEVYSTKTEPGIPLHDIANVLSANTKGPTKLPLYIVIDQYEVLPELNVRAGSELQRTINTLIKARDPVVFFKIGARTYDWGRDLSVSGAQGRIEVNRDYHQLDLSSVLLKREAGTSALFPGFARDVAVRRVQTRSGRSIPADWAPEAMLGERYPLEEAASYSPKRNTGKFEERLVGDVPTALKERLLAYEHGKPLQLRLAGAWTAHALRRGGGSRDLLERFESRSWRKQAWTSGRTDVALFQIARAARKRRTYSGWATCSALAGANISVFLLMMAEMWDAATRRGLDPLHEGGIPPEVQSMAIYSTSELWRNRDRSDHTGGGRRFSFVNTLGRWFWLETVDDTSLANPGHNGFSLSESDFLERAQTESPDDSRAFLKSCVNWAILEERRHAPREYGPNKAVRFYLHPILSPTFGISRARIGDPVHVSLEDVATIRDGTIPPTPTGTAGYRQTKLQAG